MSEPIEEPLFQRLRRRKAISFIISEAVALGVLALVGAFAVSRHLTDPSLVMSVNVLTLIAATAVVVIPIIFFAIAPVIPREKR